MDTAQAIAIGKQVARMANKVLKYIRDDNAHAYGLEEAAEAVVSGEGCVPWPEPGPRDDGAVVVDYAHYTTADGTLEIEVLGPARVRLVAHPFAADTQLWNGPDLLPDTQYRSMLASLFHDLIWAHRKELSEVFGVPIVDVLDWGTDIMYTIWVWASGNALQRLEARISWRVCRFAAPWYHSAKKALRLAALTAAALPLLCGCGTPPDWRVESVSGTNAVMQAVAEARRGQTSERMGDGRATPALPADDSADALPPAAETPENPPSSTSSTSSAASSNPNGFDGSGLEKQPGAGASGSADAVDFSSLEWRWGNFKGSGAKLADGCRIGALKVSGSSLSFKWIEGGCEKLDAACTHANPCCTCALFCLINGKWVGGKFEHISTDRTSRNLTNINEGYGGWDKSAVEKADAFAFVILDDGAKRRSNVAIQEK